MILVGFLLALSGAAPLTFPKVRDCNLPAEREAYACIYDNYKVWDKSLNEEYRAALARIDADRRPLLVKAQRSWVVYRDANCAVGYAHGGTVSTYLGNQCLLDMTRDRSKELHVLHIDDSD